MLSFSNPPLLCLSVLFFLLQHSPVLSFETGTYNQCSVAHFVPGYNLVGEGFDVVTLERKRAYVINVTSYLTPSGTCKLYRNPLQGNTLQKVPVSAVDWRAYSEWKVRHHHNEHTSISSLITKYSNKGSNGWKIGLNFTISTKLDIVGTQSEVYTYAKSMSEKDYYSFSSHRVTCIHYSYRVSNTPKLSNEFQQDLKRLPYSYNSATKPHYRRLIDTYGTHYMRRVELGGQLNRVAAARTCLSSLNGFSSHQVHSCFKLGFSVGLGYSISANQSCNNILHNQDVYSRYRYSFLDHYTNVVGGRGWSGEFSLIHKDSQGYQNWQETLKDHPDVVEYYLRPLHELVPGQTRKRGLKTAIVDYLKENAITPSQPGRCPNQNCCPQQAWRGTLVVTIIRGWNLKGDYAGMTEAYVILKHNNGDYRTRQVVSNDPFWNARFDLGKVDPRDSLTIQVWDEDISIDDLLLYCTVTVEEGTNKHTCSGDLASIEFKCTLTCDRHLTGDRCNEYKPTPH